VHRKRSQVAVIDARGEVLVNRNVPNAVEPILQVIGGLPPGTPAAFEAASGTGWLVELLEGYGFDPHLVHPSRCKAIASARLKNDKGRCGDLRSCCARTCSRMRGSPPPAVRQLRALLRHRVQLVRLRTLLRNRIHAVLAGHGHDRPAGVWSGPGREWLASLPLRAASREVIQDGLALTDATKVRIGQPRLGDPPAGPVRPAGQGADPAARGGAVHRTGHPRRDRRHHPVPDRPQAGVLGRADPGRPRQRPRRHYGHISKQGSTWLRWVLCEAAQTAKRSPQFAADYQAIAQRRGKKIATTAVARKLLTRARHLLTDAQRAALPPPATTPAPDSRRSSQTRRGRQAPGELEDHPEPALPRLTN
jgi:transposase